MEIHSLDWRIVAPVPLSNSCFTLFGISPRHKFSNCPVLGYCHSINTIYIASDIYEP